MTYIKKLFLLLLISSVGMVGKSVFAQDATAKLIIRGKITDKKTKEAIAGVSVTEIDAEGRIIKGSTSDIGGNFVLKIINPKNKISVSNIGYKSITKEATSTTIDVVLAAEGEQELQEVQIVGSRNAKRTVVNSAVPIDIIDVKSVTTQSGKLEINELLQYVAPSFNANKQSGSDGADHVDPASLRGMGPDQTLVLINGKRRHQSSLINLFGTRGRGNTGTDLNAIPASAIKRIEILDRKSTRLNSSH